MDYIQRNAYMVEEVIEWVNGLKVGSEKNVVLGMSMGGLVARYALRHMEQTGRIHDTKLYISHDVPHQGANVPLAFQALVRHLAGESVRWPLLFGLTSIDFSIANLFPELNNGMAILQSPAAQQMLIYQLSGSGSSIANTTNSLRQSFVSEYTGMGYPVQGGIRCIAISNGSECGTPLGFQPYSVLVNIDFTYDLNYFVGLFARGVSLTPLKMITSLVSTNTDVKAQFITRALPDQQSRQIYSGKLFIKKKVLGFINIEEQLINEKTLNSTAAMLPLDNAGGGVYDIAQLVSLPPEISQYILEPRFSFIPTYSSLDIGSGLQTIVLSDLICAYSVVSPPASPKDTPFQNFFTNPSTSENHIQFTLNFGNWLLAELAGNPVLSSCNHLCTGTSIYPSISDSSVICSSGGIFTLNNLPQVDSIIWTCGPYLTVSSGQYTSSCTFSSTGNNSSWIRARLVTGCGSIVLQKTVWSGVPRVEVTGPSEGYAGGSYTYYANPAQGSQTTSYQWTLSPPYDGNYIYGYGDWANTSFNYSGGGYFQVGCTGHNNCGDGIMGTAYILISENGLDYIVSPNPASTTVTISVATAVAGAVNLPDINAVYDVSIHNLNGVLQSRNEYSGDRFTIPVNNLKDGNYLIRIDNGKSVSVKQLIINR